MITYIIHITYLELTSNGCNKLFLPGEMALSNTVTAIDHKHYVQFRATACKGKKSYCYV